MFRNSRLFSYVIPFGNARVFWSVRGGLVTIYTGGVFVGHLRCGRFVSHWAAHTYRVSSNNYRRAGQQHSSIVFVINVSCSRDVEGTRETGIKKKTFLVAVYGRRLDACTRNCRPARLPAGACSVRPDPLPAVKRRRPINCPFFLARRTRCFSNVTTNRPPPQFHRRTVVPSAPITGRYPYETSVFTTPPCASNIGRGKYPGNVPAENDF